MKEINGIKIFESEIEIIGIYFSRAIVERILRVIVLCLIPLTIVLILKKSSYDLVLSILTTIFMLGFFYCNKSLRSLESVDKADKEELARIGALSKTLNEVVKQIRNQGRAATVVEAHQIFESYYKKVYDRYDKIKS